MKLAGVRTFANHQLIAAVDHFDFAAKHRDEGVDGRAWAQLGRQLGLPLVVVEDQDSALPQERPAEDDVHQHVVRLMGAVDVDDVVGVGLELHQRLLGGADDRGELALETRSRDVGDEALLQLLREDVERRNARARLGEDVLDHPDRGAAFEDTYLQVVEVAAPAEGLEKTIPLRDVFAEPVFREAEARSDWRSGGVAIGASLACDEGKAQCERRCGVAEAVADLMRDGTHCEFGFSGVGPCFRSRMTVPPIWVALS